MAEPTQQLNFPLDTVTQKIIRDAVRPIVVDEIYKSLISEVVHYQTFWESLDGWNQTENLGGSGQEFTVATSGQGLRLTTGNSSDDAEACEKFFLGNVFFNFERRMKLRTAARWSAITDQQSRILVGGDGSRSFGFQVTNATLQGLAHDNTASVTTNLLTITANTTFELEARYIPNDKVVFLVDGVERGTVSTSLPSSGSNDVNFMILDILTNANANKTIRVFYLMFSQGIF